MDNTAGMPVDERVLEHMIPYFNKRYGNPASIHSFGQEAREAILEARGKIAKLFGIEKDEEIIFTASGTESNNLAIKGVAYRNKAKGNHIVTSSIEHISVINTCKSLMKEGFEISFLPVDKYGIIDIQKLEKEITKNTILVSIMYANGEIGSIEPIKKIGEIVHNKGVLFHVDAIAAEGHIPINVKKEKIDLLSLSSNDINGPRGIGALYIKTGSRVQPIIHGGGQERGMRK
jgi:cysteine desulfurase